MKLHAAIGATSSERQQLIRALIQSGEIEFAGNKQLKIFGTLNCKSGKRMLLKNRVFFVSEEEAIAEGYRPCAHCMKEKFKRWKEAYRTDS